MADDKTETIESPTTPTAQVGDKVWYVPGLGHAFDVGRNDQYIWEAVAVGPDGEHKVLTDQQAGEYRQLGHNDPRRRDLGVHRCRTQWPAVITVLHPDGAADLDIDYQVKNVTGVTNTYSKVPFDADGEKPHSWNTKGGK